MITFEPNALHELAKQEAASVMIEARSGPLLALTPQRTEALVAGAIERVAYVAAEMAMLALAQDFQTREIGSNTGRMAADWAARVALENRAALIAISAKLTERGFI